MSGISIKFSKDTVAFEHPAKGPNHCGGCQHFKGNENRCAIVSGVVTPADWCKKFKQTSCTHSGECFGACSRQVAPSDKKE